MNFTVWDNHKTVDRHTVLYGDGSDLTMSEDPTWPQGVCQHGFDSEFKLDCSINKNGKMTSQLGIMIDFNDLPESCKRVIAFDLKEAEKVY